MPLDFGGIQSPLFNNSNISGEGLSGDQNQALLNNNNNESTPQLTVFDFQVNAGYGDATDPEKINDGATDDEVIFTATGQIVIIDLGSVYRMTQWRQYGYSTARTGDFKMEYLSTNSGNWEEWTTFSLHESNAWTSWAALKEIRTQKIKITSTVIDNVYSYLREIEIKY